MYNITTIEPKQAKLDDDNGISGIHAIIRTH